MTAVEQAKHWLEMPQLAEPEIKKAYNAIGNLPRGYAIKDNDDWCACMVSVALYKEGTDIREVSADKLWNKAKSSTHFGPVISRYVIPGDLVGYDWNGNGTIDHVGIVESHNENVITTLEGNVNNRMHRRTFTEDSKVKGVYPVFLGSVHVEPVEPPTRLYSAEEIMNIIKQAFQNA